LESVCATEHAFSFFEAPHRIKATLIEGAQFLVERQIVLAREVTKVHQEFIRGTSSEVLERLVEPRGEFTIIVGPLLKLHNDNRLSASDDAVVREFWRLTEIGGSSRREVVRLVAESSGRSSKDVYSAIERAKKLV
jgi:16S rRNA (cytidine1402-2'-O)-methyltransferase